MDDGVGDFLPINRDHTPVTPRFKDKFECKEYMYVRIKVHTCIDSVNIKTQCKSVKEALNIYYMTVCLKLTHVRVANSGKVNVEVLHRQLTGGTSA
jgi:hypothetical protein